MTRWTYLVHVDTVDGLVISDHTKDVLRTAFRHIAYDNLEADDNIADTEYEVVVHGPVVAAP
jgi:hypothetical protein